jgi:hypothetical protein
MDVTGQVRSETGFERWRDGLKSDTSDPNWNKWDHEIQLAVREYKQHLNRSARSPALDWTLIKAMVWVETGANNPEWHIKPMQIGVVGDPGLKALLSEREGGDLIVPPMWIGRLTIASVRSSPVHNIRAGIGYLLMRMANFEYRTVSGADSTTREIIVKPFDTLESVARHNGSTVDTLRRVNPATDILRPGQVLRVQKASVRRVIASWRRISTDSVARRYNGGGDPDYARKLDFALTLIRATENHA